MFYVVHVPMFTGRACFDGKPRIIGQLLDKIPLLKLSLSREHSSILYSTITSSPHPTPPPLKIENPGEGQGYNLKCVNVRLCNIASPIITDDI